MAFKFVGRVKVFYRFFQPAELLNQVVIDGGVAASKYTDASVDASAFTAENSCFSTSQEQATFGKLGVDSKYPTQMHFLVGIGVKPSFKAVDNNFVRLAKMDGRSYSVGSADPSVAAIKLQQALEAAQSDTAYAANGYGFIREFRTLTYATPQPVRTSLLTGYDAETQPLNVTEWNTTAVTRQDVLNAWHNFLIKHPGIKAEKEIKIENAQPGAVVPLLDPQIEYTASWEIKYTYPADIFEIVETPVWYDDVKRELVVTHQYLGENPDELAALKVIVDEHNANLYAVADQRVKGIDAKVSTTKPVGLSKLTDPTLKQQGEDWWLAYLEGAQQVNSIVLGDETAMNTWLEANPDKTKADWLVAAAAAAQAAGANAASSQSLWQTAWDGLKDVASGAADYIGKWSPIEWMGGYAGYTAIQSAKKSSVPTWLIVAGAGLAFAALLK